MNLRYRVPVGALSFWILLAGLFILRSPSGAFTHDFRGHVEHTRILYNERRLALPREGWETYQPPLYYLVNTLFSPNDKSHVFKIRCLSVLYGSLTLLLMSWMLARCGMTPPVQLTVLFFLATTPAFLFLFTSYNNDSLATFLSVAILAAAYAWVQEGRRWTIWALTLLSTAGLYTKLSVAFPLAVLGLVLGFLGWTRRIPRGRLWAALSALAISVLLLTPWLLGHNYRLTGQFTPVPADFPLAPEIRLQAAPLRILLTPPGWTRGEWQDPYVHTWEKSHHKKNSFLAYVFVTSIFGEYTFEFMPPIIPWAIIGIQSFLLATALVGAKKSPHASLAFSFVLLGVLSLTSFLFRAPYATQMDFRYIAWVWLPMAIIYAASLESRFLRAVMLGGTFVQGLLWLALIVGGQWNIP